MLKNLFKNVKLNNAQFQRINLRKREILKSRSEVYEG